MPFPHRLADYPRTLLANMANQFAWGQHEALRDWMRTSRLDGFGKLMASAGDDAGKQAVVARFREMAGAAMANLPRLLPRA